MYISSKVRVCRLFPAFQRRYYSKGLQDMGISSTSPNVVRNGCTAMLVENAIKYEGSQLTATGAIVARSGKKTGRSPKDKRVVEESSSRSDVWWGPVNTPLSEDSFQKNKKIAIDFLKKRDRIYVTDAFASHDKTQQIKIRVVTSRAYHALFMKNMLVRPSDEELSAFDDPNWVIYNAGEIPADANVEGVDTGTSVAINFATKEMVILGTEYAGEMKKGVFTILNYLAPKGGDLSMHASANEDPDTKSTSIFFGLSGTGKTTLSADTKRNLIGDDEHIWTKEGIANIEGGCYAKCIDLNPKSEPEIFSAIRWGAVQENVVLDPKTHESKWYPHELPILIDRVSSALYSALPVADLHIALTENTRVAYPLENVSNALIPAQGTHPNNVIMLTCDAFGVLPPVSKLSADQAMYHFISGYTAKVAGTEVGVTEPEATFSACFGAPFLVWHPTKYAELLAQKLQQHNCHAWLVNTGWSGGDYNTGKRMNLQYTRAIIDSINNGELADVETKPLEGFGLRVPVKVSGVPDDMLTPESTWTNKTKYKEARDNLVNLFRENFSKFEDQASTEVRKAGPSTLFSEDI